MGTRDRGRFGRLLRRDEEPDEDSVALSGSDDHAWWADRRSLAGAPTSAAPSRPTAPEAPTEAPPVEGAVDWSAEALFADAGFDVSEPAQPPPQDDGATTVLVSGGLDEARLVLGVDEAADLAEVTAAHRRLAKQFHPDRLGHLSGDAQELGQARMAEINRAFETLREHLPA